MARTDLRLQAVLQASGEGGVSFRLVEGDAERAFSMPLSPETLRDWGARYAEAAARDARNAPAALKALGAAMTELLNQDGAVGLWLQAHGPRRLEIRSDEEDAARLFDAPWEILVRPGGGFLAEDAERPFLLARRLGEPARAASDPAPLSGELSLLFMAAAPEGVAALDFAAEEAAILAATADLDRLRLTVEESGALSGFRRMLIGEQGPFQAAHLSCHGDLDPEGRPLLFLETEEGEQALVGPGDLIPQLGSIDKRPPFLFLSACRTAEEGGAGDPLSVHFVRRMIAAGFGAALGWGASVFDQDAGDFARAFYRGLSAGERLDEAAAGARRALLRAQEEDPAKGRGWHMARLHLGPSGGGPLCDPRSARRRKALPGATPSGEVLGRRRETQRLLKVFRRPRAQSRGAVIYGLGLMGKSSLAARLAAAAPQMRTIRLSERFEARAVFKALLGGAEARRRRDLKEHWGPEIEESLEDALDELLGSDALERPILFLIDGLERILEPPSTTAHPRQTRQRIKNAPLDAEAWRRSLGAVLRAFARDSSGSGLLVASRWDFELPNGRGGDDARWLERLPLASLPVPARRQQERRARADLLAALAAQDAAFDAAPRLRRLERALSAASGNPGVMAALARLTIEDHAEAEGALAELEDWVFEGKAPEGAPLAQSVLRRLSLPSYAQGLSAAQRKILQGAARLREDDKPAWSALEAMGVEMGLEQAEAQAALERLAALGLLEEARIGRPPTRHGAIAPLARPLIGGSPS